MAYVLACGVSRGNAPEDLFVVNNIYHPHETAQGLVERLRKKIMSGQRFPGLSLR